MKASDVLKFSKGLISTPETWCKGSYAKTQSGNVVSAMSKEAHSFCAIGALNRATSYAYKIDSPHYPIYYLDAVARECGSVALRPTVDYNDTRDHGDVMSLYDAAINMAVNDEASGEAKK